MLSDNERQRLKAAIEVKESERNQARRAYQTAPNASAENDARLNYEARERELNALYQQLLST